MIKLYLYQKLPKISFSSLNKGFTLIEILLVLIIIGILSAIALPSFLNQANKARQSEAKTYIGSINRSQQAYRLENSTFAYSISNLGVGIPQKTAYYEYEIGQIPVSSIATYSTATAQEGSLQAYVGAVQIMNESSGNNPATTSTILCSSGSVTMSTPTSALINNYDPNNVTGVELECIR